MVSVTNRILNQKNLLFVLFVLTVIIMLIAGLKPRGYRVFNRTALLPDGKGMRFKTPSIVYTKEAWPLGRPETTDSSFTVSMRLTPLHFCKCYVARIVSFCDTDDNENIIFGQYNHSLIIEDHTGRLRKRIDCDSVFRPGKEVCISITSGTQETKIFVDGKRRKAGQRNIFDAGCVVHPGRIFVGNSPDGRCTLEGTLESIEIDKNKLSDEELAASKTPLSPQNPKSAADTRGPIALYDFTKGSGFRIANEFGKDKGLYVPRFFTMLKFNILSFPDINNMLSIGSLQDYIVNFFGFVPFGFLLAVLLWLKGRKRRTAIVITTVIGGVFSLFIELVQAYIPTRSSEVSDLFLNTMGALCGAILVLLVIKTSRCKTASKCTHATRKRNGI
jgi:hypothetical protein